MSRCRVRVTQFIAQFIAHFLSFCHSVCGLSLFIVRSPSDQITELCKLHFGSDKRVGYHFDYCTLWHSARWMKRRDGHAKLLQRGRRPDLPSATFCIQNDNPCDALFNHDIGCFSRLANRFNRKQEKKNKADVRTSGFHHNGATGANQILLLLCD